MGNVLVSTKNIYRNYINDMTMELDTYLKIRPIAPTYIYIQELKDSFQYMLRVPGMTLAYIDVDEYNLEILDIRPTDNLHIVYKDAVKNILPNYIGKEFEFI